MTLKIPSFFHKIIEKYNEHRTINVVLRASKEPSLSGDLKELLKQID